MGFIGDAYEFLTGDRGRQDNEFAAIDPQGRVSRQSTTGEAWGHEGYEQYNQRAGQIDTLTEQLQRLARGENSISQEQLRQATNRNVAQQMGIAASARPSNAAMAARLASQNTADLGAQGAQAQALAGIQERQAAQQALSNLLLGARGQDVQLGLGGLGLGLQGSLGLEQQRGSRFASIMGVPSSDEKGMAGLVALGRVAAMASDRNLKTNISNAGKEADQFLNKLEPYSYEYKPGAGATWPYPGDIGGGTMPRGRQMGVMAQDLERSRMGANTVDQTPQGKMVETAQLTSALAAAAARLNERLRAVEGKKARGN